MFSKVCDVEFYYRKYFQQSLSKHLCLEQIVKICSSNGFIRSEKLNFQYERRIYNQELETLITQSQRDTINKIRTYIVAQIAEEFKIYFAIQRASNNMLLICYREHFQLYVVGQNRK